MTCVAVVDRPIPHEAQRHVLDHADRFNVVVCGRRWGKTDIGVTLALEVAGQGGNAGWFAPTYALLDEAWERFHEAVPKILIRRSSKQSRRIELVGGGHIDFWTLKQTTKDQSVSGRGRDYHRAIVDEAALAPSLGRDWTQAIRPTLSDHRGDAWFFSTPHGQNEFYRLWMKGEQDASVYHRYSMSESNASRRSRGDRSFRSLVPSERTRSS